jgi:hypothetical protein
MAFVSLPNTGQTLGQTRAQIKENFDVLAATEAVNHYPVNDVNAGKHQVAQWPEQITFPLTPANEGSTFARDYNARTELAWRPENELATGDQYILTGMPTRAAMRFDGSGALGVKPAIGLSFNVTSVTKLSNTTFQVVFATTFPIAAVPPGTANYLIIGTAWSSVGGSPVGVGATNLTAAGFVLTVDNALVTDISFVVMGG